MTAKVILSSIQGGDLGATWVFEERATCLAGRADECQLRFPNDAAHRTLSRHHCLFDINPPQIRVRDFGSLNGTLVNGTKIGQRPRGTTPEHGAQLAFPEVDLEEGDLLQLGPALLRVHIERPTTVASAPPPRCAACGQPLAEIAPPAGEMLCATCRGDLSRLLHQLLGHARQGKAPLATLAGYTLLKELGRGGMGAVYLARREEQSQPVALKVMLPQGAASERATAQFLREIEQTKRLQHPHLVQLYEAGYAEGIYFFTLEYCAGGSLRQLLSERGGPLPVEEACLLILQALAGLHYAHTLDQPVSAQAAGQGSARQGLVHRDIKPANLFLSGIGQAALVKIGDFGLAKAFDLAGLSGLTRTGAIMGTPAYMPRQLAVNFKYAQPAVDVWAMAASLYHLLTGTVPRNFAPGRDPWLVVLQSQAVPIRQQRATIPRRLAEVIDHALQDQPEIGFQSALEFKQALEAALT